MTIRTPGSRRLAVVAHLARRFLGSLSSEPPVADNEEWALGWLLPGEREIWCRMSSADRRHAVGVARAVADRSVEPPSAPLMAAALLHDSGKVISGLGTPARVLATVVWAVADDRRARSWAGGRAGLRRRLGQYRLHPELGAQLLEAAGSDPMTSRWAAEHHSPESTWAVPVALGRILKACDDD